MLLRQLPADAATSRALDVRAEWSAGEYLLAACADLLQQLVWVNVEVNKRKGAKNPRPTPVPRPGDEQAERDPVPYVSGRELAEWLKKVS